MFTGLVEEVGKVRSVVSGDSDATLVIEAPAVCGDLAVGDSIAVNGVCLTATAVDNGRFTAIASGETLQRTTLGRLQAGDGVNLERALRLSDRLGGHLVTGHVDGVGHVREIVEEGSSVRMTFELPARLKRYVVEKGSIAVDGVSLTVAEVTPTGCRVVVIPHTLTHTTLGARRIGDPVNIEADLLAKYVERLLEPAEGGGSQP